jgi:hypothetical protein
MSRKLLAFLLSELETVRLICQKENCGGVIECRLDRLGDEFLKLECPICKDLYRDTSGKPEPLSRLANAIRELRKHEKRVIVEFVIAARD